MAFWFREVGKKSLHIPPLSSIEHEESGDWWIAHYPLLRDDMPGEQEGIADGMLTAEYPDAENLHHVLLDTSLGDAYIIPYQNAHRFSSEQEAADALWAFYDADDDWKGLTGGA